MPLFGKTSPEDMLIEIVLVVLIAFIPSIIYMIVLRYIEKYDREPWGSMFTVFLWGATMGVVVVIIFRGMFYVHFGDYYPDLASDRELTELIAAVLITPIIAELIKPAGLLFVRYDIEESEDGLIYGAVSGLGYAATENLLFGIFLVSIYGMDFFISIVIIRSISVVLLNASASALTGFGVSRATAQKHKTGSLWAFPGFLITAIAMHAFFNFLMVSGLGIQDISSVSSSLAFAIMLSIIFMTWIYFKIYRLDRLDDKPEEPEGEPPPMPGQRPMHARRPPPDYYDDHDRPPPRREHYPRDMYDQREPERRPIQSAPPRATRVGPTHAPHHRPPPVYHEPQAQQPHGHRRHIEQPRAAPTPTPHHEPAPSRIRPKPKTKPRAEDVPDWDKTPEDEAVEAIDWEPVEDEPRKPAKRKGVKKKSAAAVDWTDDNEDDMGKKSNTDENNIDEWWSEDD